MKANFIIPSWSYWKEPLRAQPLTQLYLATILEQEGVDVTFTDFRDKPNWNIPKIIKEVDMYLYTVASPDFKEVEQIRQGIKKSYPKSKHIAGGPHASIVPQDFENFDSVVVGRGEEALTKILEDFPDVHSLYKEKADGLYPFPRRHFLSKEKIAMNNLFKTDNMKSTTAQFSFGCLFSCSFCANYNKDSLRRNPLEQISEEIDYLKSEYGIEGLSLQDEICIPKKPTKYLDMLISKNIKWRGQVRATIDENTMQHAKESGLIELAFGLESCDQDVLDCTNKKIKVEDVERTLEYCKKYDIKTRVYLLNGLPGEDESIVPKTIEFIERNNPDLVLLSSLMPYPGSPIERNPEKYGMKNLKTDYENFNHLLCRFDDSNDNIENAVPYEFEEGKGLSRGEIKNNLINLQSYLRGRDMNK